jgi:multidrug transporter EmrE-like cation transporter
MTYVYLALAVIFEVGWALSMKLSEGFTKPRFIGATAVLYLLSGLLLGLAAKRMDIGVAYAIWVGAGVALVAVAGITFFNEPVSAAKVLALALIVTGIVLLQVTGGGH